jgi:hypothetical protein
MALLSDYTTKLRMAFDRHLPAEARAFAPTIMVNDVAALHVEILKIFQFRGVFLRHFASH